MKPLPQTGLSSSKTLRQPGCVHHDTPIHAASVPVTRHAAANSTMLPLKHTTHAPRATTALASTLSTERTPSFNAQPAAPSASSSTAYSKGRVVRGTVVELHAGAATVLLADGSTRAQLPFESITKRYTPVHSPQGMVPPLAVGEQILAMVRPLFCSVHEPAQT